jgi:CheY-like chemotaxis protein
MNILLAEDYEPRRSLIEMTLTTDDNIVVVCARDGSEALAIASDHRAPLHLLVSEIELPDMDGIELALAIRSARPDIPTLLTGSEIPSGRAKPAFAHFLKQPFTPSALMAAVRGALGPRVNAAGATFDYSSNTD